MSLGLKGKYMFFLRLSQYCLNYPQPLMVYFDHIIFFKIKKLTIKNKYVGLLSYDNGLENGAFATEEQFSVV